MLGGEADVPADRSGNDLTPNRPRVPLPRASRYDVILAVIPAAFLITLASTALLPIQPRQAVLTAGLVGALAIADGLSRNPPRTGSVRHDC